jgi:hypothetical protein
MVRLTFGFNLSLQTSDDSSKDSAFQALTTELDYGVFYGISSSANIKPFLSNELLNLSLFFRKENLYLSANEVEIVLALAMMNEGKVALDHSGHSGSRNPDQVHQLSGILHEWHH